VKFVNPSWLWLLLLIPGLYIALLLHEKKRKAQFEKFVKSSLWPDIVPELDPRARIVKGRLFLAALFFTLIALARPQWGTHEEIAHVTGLDIMVALDLSNSMEVEDVSPNRLKKAKHLVRNLAERLRGDRIGLIAFAGSSFIASPLTNDLEYISSTLEILGSHSITSQGTDISAALESAARGLDRGAEESAPVPEVKSFPSRVVLLITDGEDQEGGAAEAAAQLKNSDVKLYIIGVGTQKGGPIPMRDADGTLRGYKKDRKNQPIISTFQPDQLTALAAAGGGKYWNATPDESEIEEILTDLNALNRAEYTERRYLVYEDRFQFPLAIAVLFLLLELGIPHSRKSTSSKIQALMVAVLCFASLGHSHAAQAAVPLDVYLENKKGVKAFSEGDAEAAKKHFGTAQAIDPTRPELEFNQGVIRLQEGDAEAAARSFEQAAKLGQGNSALSGQALYNLGGALVKKGDIPNAIRSYLGAISQAQRANDTQLGDDARKNLELLIQQQQQHKQKQQEKQNKNEQEKQKQEQEQDQEKQKQDQKNQENQKEKKPNQYEDPKESRKRQFRSPKLSHEDAERVMAELKNREKELHNRLKKQQGTARGVQKDW